ncbi:putative low-complexity protein [Frankia torreyi]|uniref:Putative low-complexity protein n=1 Tax=Frankia torreyi TaxID=1856 RepID=A0A0D8BM30_9ACTN|nr:MULTISPECIES: pentapeptide repeat-containing protein [Frankia]KJE24487.1 putative low-complexity protein [Frankia torreyi]
MASKEHVNLLSQGVDGWNEWRRKHPDVRPEFSGVTFREANLVGAELNGGDFRDTRFVDTQLYGANLRAADFTSTQSPVSAHILSVRGFEEVHDYRGGADLGGTDLSCADLSGANLSEANLRRASLERATLDQASLRRTDLFRANLSGADLSYADLREATLVDATIAPSVWQHDIHFGSGSYVGTNSYGIIVSYAEFDDEGSESKITPNLMGANLRGADLRSTTLVEANLEGADLTGCHVYGISAWGLRMSGATQKDLVITAPGEPVVTVDDLEVAQFVHLMLNNGKIRNVIDTITSKAVLILGRFTAPRKEILDSLKDQLRRRGYLPIMFDFDGPASRNLTETVSTLAHLARFIVADISDAKSIPQELMRIVPSLPSVPVQPLIQSSHTEYGMFKDFRDYPWVLQPYVYDDPSQLLASLEQQIIRPAAEKADEIRARRATS